MRNTNGPNRAERLLRPTALRSQTCAATTKNERISIYMEPPPKGLEIPFSTIYSPEAQDFVAELVTTFDSHIERLYSTRLSRKCIYQQPHQLPKFANSLERHDNDWKIAPVPSRLRNRHLDLGDVSPTNTEHFLKALQSDVQGIQVDFDDGHCPTWRNQLVGLHNIYKVVHNLIPGLPALDALPLLMLRPRAWNMIECNMMVDGKEVPGPLFDFGFLMFHNARKLVTAHSGPFFYLSKLEGAEEAKLWNDIFIWTQQKLGLPLGIIKACVLIENILSAFEMDEILYALRDHSLGLNCGIWDYAASIICKFGNKKSFMLPDRNKYVNMDRHFLKCYMQLVVKTCHKRGAHATGGMAAHLLPEEPWRKDEIVRKVCSAKLQEIHEGVDGFMVYDTGLVPHINKLWKDHAPEPNQFLIKHTDILITPEDLLQMPSGGVTMTGLKHNIAVAILFIYHWLKGNGHFSYKDCVEDSATAEISRSQIWQWIRHKATMEDYNGFVTKDLVMKLAGAFICESEKNKLYSSVEDRSKLLTAMHMFMEICTKREFPDFITTYLNDSHIFQTVHRQNQLRSHL